MLKKLLLLAAVAACAVGVANEAVPAAQVLPKAGYVTLASGDYAISVMPTSN